MKKLGSLMPLLAEADLDGLACLLEVVAQDICTLINATLRRIVRAFQL